MSWSNEWPKSKACSEWKNSPGFAEKLDKAFENDPEWQEHIDINGGINPVALGVPSSTPEQLEADLAFYTVKPITLSLIINEGDFPTTIEAIQVGDLAVHRNLRKEGYWQVTHVPTLTRFNAVPNGLHKQADLIAWCKKVQIQLPEDWKELAQLTQECYKERSAAKDRIMYLCQGMEVGE